MKETLLEGVGPDDISEAFLIMMMEVADEFGLSVDGISVIRTW